MRVAVASGKGGAGKTTVAVSLALTAPRPARLLDCDVEEPNAHLFTAPRIVGARPVTVPVPAVDAVACDGCGVCSASCAFNALVCLGGAPLLFEELCHGCGVCSLVCPQGAIGEREREIGTVEWGEIADGVGFVQGRLRLGEAKAPPVIEAVLDGAEPAGFSVVDCPPGTACPFVAAVRGADVALLVTEPTPFGLSDLMMAVDAVRELGVPCGVVVNRAGCGDDRVADYCREQAVPVLAEIPDDRRIAVGYARGLPSIVAAPWLEPVFAGLHEALARLAGGGRPGPVHGGTGPTREASEVPR